MDIETRDYQTEAIENYRNWVLSDERHGTIILPPGTGKTLIGTKCLSLFPEKKYLWVAHRVELIDQAVETIRSFCPEAKISSEIAGRKGKLDSDIVVGSVATLIRDRQHLRGWIPDMIFIDEYHHYSDDNVQYKSLKKRWPHAKICGLTATLWRNDEMPLPMGKILYHMDILTAIEKGWLVDPKFEHVSSFNLKNFKFSSLLESHPSDDLIVERVLELVAEGRQGMLFGGSTDHARELFDAIKDHCRAAQVYHDTPSSERREIITQFKNGEIDVLVNFRVGVEGLNIPHLSFIAIAGEIESLNVLQQIIGRGLRTHPGKTDCIVLDIKKTSKDDLKASLKDINYRNTELNIFNHKIALPKALNKTVKPVLIGILNKLIKV